MFGLGSFHCWVEGISVLLQTVPFFRENGKKEFRSNQIKHQLDATLCRFYFCRVTLHVSGASAHHQEYLKLVQRPLVCVLSLQVSRHITLLGPKFRP
jgi:hypothetical protein